MCGFAHMFNLDCFMTACLLGPPTASPFRFSPAAGRHGMPSASGPYSQSLCVWCGHMMGTEIDSCCTECHGMHSCQRCSSGAAEAEAARALLDAPAYRKHMAFGFCRCCSSAACRGHS